MYISLTPILIIFVIGIFTFIGEKILKQAGQELNALILVIVSFLCCMAVMLTYVWNIFGMVWEMFMPY